MAKKNTKLNRTKSSRKTLDKKTQTKTHNNSDTFKDEKNFIKKYPGFVVAIIFSVIVIALLLFSTTSTNPDLEEQMSYVKQMHMENVIFVEDTTAAVEAELDGEYGDTLEDDYLMSILWDLDWFSKIEFEIYSSKPTSDVFVKEIAVAAFRNRMIELNEEFTFNVLDFDQEYVIKLALEKEPVQNFITEEDLIEVFEDNEADKKLFLATLDYLIKSYFEEKKMLINYSTSPERKFVEAKKIVLLTY